MTPAQAARIVEDDAASHAAAARAAGDRDLSIRWDAVSAAFGLFAGLLEMTANDSR